MRTARGPVLLAACFILACPSDPANDDGETGGETEGDGGVCHPAEDEANASQTFTFNLINDGPDPVYLPGGHCNPLQWLLRVDDVEVRDDPVEQTNCSSLVESSFCGSGCKDGSGTIAPIRIGPGDTWVVTWDAYVWAEVEIPGSCINLQCPETFSCPAGRQVVDGASVELTVPAYPECSGSCDCGGGETSCMLALPDEGPSIGGTSTDYAVEFSYAAGGSVDLHMM